MIIGPSGSGKSTLLALLSGLLRPDQGRVLPLGVDLWQLSDAARRRFRLAHYGFVFQGYHLFPSLNARQQLEIVLRWGQDMSARHRAKAMEVLELLGLGQKSKLLPLGAVGWREAAGGYRASNCETARLLLCRRADQLA